MVAYALSRRERLNMVISSEELIKEFEKLEIEVFYTDLVDARIYSMTFQPELLEKIRSVKKK